MTVDDSLSMKWRGAGFALFVGLALQFTLVKVVWAADSDPATQRRAENPLESTGALLSPAEVVADLEKALITSMKMGEGSGFKKRREFLAPVLSRVLDVERMGRFIFGATWKILDARQRDLFTHSFLSLSVSTYAARFARFKGETFSYESIETRGQRRARVRSLFTKSNGDKVTFDYLLVSDGSGWRIVNIIADGVSDLALKRTQYGGLYSAAGMAPVLEHINQQVQQLGDE